MYPILKHYFTKLEDKKKNAPYFFFLFFLLFNMEALQHFLGLIRFLDID